jgi:hypothetical protein
MKISPLVVLVLSSLVAAACSSETREGTQTNWQACARDGTCPEGYRCVEDACVPRTADAGARDSGGDGDRDGGDSGGGATGAEAGSSCRPCPIDPPNGYYMCTAGECVLGCYLGYVKVGTSCLPPSPGGPCSKDATLTAAEWAACLAPVAGPHAIDGLDCAGTPVSQDHVVMPTQTCYVSPEYTPQNPVRDCGVDPFCTHHDDCTEGPHGRCTGSPAASCEYPALLNRPCTSDADCSSVVAGANCPPLFGEDILCDPSGACRRPERLCNLPEAACESDGDCTAGAGGVCRKTVLFSRCSYPDCIEDADCGASARCACRECVPATCTGDPECGAGSECLLGDGCFGANGYHCTSPEDTCRTKEDCFGAPCEHRGGRWQCGSACPLVP